MDAFSPDFAPYWMSPGDSPDEHRSAADERHSGGDEQALAELAERVSAARSIV